MLTIETSCRWLALPELRVAGRALDGQFGALIRLTLMGTMSPQDHESRVIHGKAAAHTDAA
jgi:hypothetical protein